MQDDNKELSRLGDSDLLTSRHRYNSQDRVRETDLLKSSDDPALVTERTSFDQIMTGHAPIYRAKVMTVRVLDDSDRPCAGSSFRFGQDACASDLIGLCIYSKAQRIDHKRQEYESTSNSRVME